MRQIVLTPNLEKKIEFVDPVDVLPKIFVYFFLRDGNSLNNSSVVFTNLEFRIEDFLNEYLL